MIRFLVRRLLLVLPVLFGVFTITFLLIHFVPGDPIDLMLGDQVSQLDKMALRSEFGLDKPLTVQYFSFIRGVATGNLGTSLLSRRPVINEISERIPGTAALTLFSMLIAMGIGIPLGVLAAIYRRTLFDQCFMFAGLLGMSTPGFWMGPMLIYFFSIRLDLFPVSGFDNASSLFLPSLSLGIPLGAVLMRMTRASMLEVIKEDYMVVAKAKGLSKFKLNFKHALANAIMPVITIVGLQFGSLLTGTVVTETIFDLPGIGSLFFGAIQQRNYPLVQGCVLLISSIYVAVNLLTDLSYGLVDPRVRLS